MSIEIRWLVSTSTSSLHAAATMLRGFSIADAELAQTLQEPTDLLAQEITAAGFDQQKLVSYLIPLSASIDNNRQLTETTIRKAFGPGDLNDGAISRIASAVGEVENTFVRCCPDAIETLEVRGRVLREQWESRGPGMLATVSRLSEPELLPGQADIVLVHPASGGGGMPFMRLNLVTIEAVLANPDVALPEVVRLGWMLATLNLDLPIHSDTVPGDRLPVVGSLAMLPVALSAGEEVEWCRYSSQLVEQAIRGWHIDIEKPADVADVLMRWWETYQAARPRWTVAMAALDQALVEQNLLPLT